MSVTGDHMAAIKAAMLKTAKNADRKPEEIKLIAVSKRQSENRIKEALDEGHRVFGENRVQEAYSHWQDIRENYPDLELHLIGSLQTNKARQAVALFDFIHTIDSARLAEALSKEMQKQGRYPKCLIQVNTGEEEQKSGASPGELPELLAYCKSDCNLDISGLMCIPPFSDPPSMHFALLNKLAEENGIQELSMGMSSDYEKAIELGSTMIRVGTAFFGNRES